MVLYPPLAAEIAHAEPQVSNLIWIILLSINSMEWSMFMGYGGDFDIISGGEIYPAYQVTLSSYREEGGCVFRVIQT